MVGVVKFHRRTTRSRPRTERVLEMAKLSAENLGELHSYIEKSLIEGFSCIGVNFRPIASGGIALHKRADFVQWKIAF